MLHLKRFSWLYTGATGFVIGLIVCLVTDIGTFSFDPATGAIDVSMRDHNDIEHFRSVREDEDRWGIYVSLLANEGIYAPDDRRIVDAITELCDEIPSEPLEAYLSAARDCAEKPVPARLRQLVQQQAPPFHPAGRVVTIGVPDQDDQPPVEGANACQGGEWFRRRVLLTNPLNGRQITVLASGHYGQGICGPVVGAADLQLNEEDAFSIFDGPLDKFEEAVAIIVN